MVITHDITRVVGSGWEVMDYVQVTLSSEVDNMQNMYWQYKPSDAQNVTTVAAGKVNSSEC